jgi:hypothetical protein
MAPVLAVPPGPGYTGAYFYRTKTPGRRKNMKIEFTLDKEDFLTYQLFTASNSKTVKMRRMRSWLIIPVLYIITGILLYYVDNITLLYAFITIALLWLVFYPLYSRGLYRRHYAKHIDEHYKNRLGRSGVLSLDNDALSITDEGSEGRIKYTEIDAVTEIPDYFFVGLKSGMALILPKAKIGEPALSQIIETIIQKSGAPRNELPDWKWK